MGIQKSFLALWIAVFIETVVGRTFLISIEDTISVFLFKWIAHVNEARCNSDGDKKDGPQKQLPNDNVSGQRYRLRAGDKLPDRKKWRIKLHQYTRMQAQIRDETSLTSFLLWGHL